MSDFITLYDFGSRIPEEGAWLVTAALVPAGWVLVSYRLYKRSWRAGEISLLRKASLIGITVFLFTIFIVFLASVLMDYSKLLYVYHTDQLKVIEGRVKVIDQEPRWTPSPDEAFEIGITPFSFNKKELTTSYHKPVLHGGFLIHGVYARIFHHKGHILRIDLHTDSMEKIDPGKPWGPENIKARPIREWPDGLKHKL